MSGQAKVGRSVLAALATLVLTMTGLLPGVPNTTLAGHTLPAGIGGDCWRAGTPLWCRTAWQRHAQLDMIIWDQFSNHRPEWLPQMEKACNDWHNFSLPAVGKPDLLCHWWPQWINGPRQTINYYKWAVPPLPALVLARTFNCTTGGFCNPNDNQSINTWYSEIHMNMTAIDNLNPPAHKRRMLFAHETGHTLGLHHHVGFNVLMKPGVAEDPSGPTATDYGSNPPCSGAYGAWGIRCIFDLHD